MYRTAYRTVGVNGLSVFYREAGPQDAPTILLLHGFPSSSRMWQPLLDRLADRFHLVAPDYPGFGHSDRATLPGRTGSANASHPCRSYGAATTPHSRSGRPRHTAGTCRTPRCTSSTPATSLSTSSRT
jgi:pimeloyl-ACP methyl ester carboxylesterase